MPVCTFLALGLQAYATTFGFSPGCWEPALLGSITSRIKHDHGQYLNVNTKAKQESHTEVGQGVKRLRHPLVWCGGGGIVPPSGHGIQYPSLKSKRSSVTSPWHASALESCTPRSPRVWLLLRRILWCRPVSLTLEAEEGES